VREFLFSGARGAAHGLKEALSLHRDLRVVQSQLDREQREEQLLRPKPEEPSCVRHGWGRAPFPGGPKPPASACPECLKEAEPARSEAELESLSRPQQVSAWEARETPVMAQRWVEHEDGERRYPYGSFGERVSRGRAGMPLPTALVESEAIEYMDAKRDEAIAADRAPKGRVPGRVVMERIEGGRVVQFVAPPNRRGLVRRVI
jgi:hypothetical protein